MAQYLEKSALVAEIDRLQKPTMDANHNFTSDYNQGIYDGLSQLELFIESLPKEKKPIREYVSPEDSTLGKLLKEMKDFSPEEDLGISNEEYNDFVNELIFGKEEPVSNDLEEAASQYPSIICQISPQWTSEVENVFKAGAEWQKENLWKNAQGDDLPEIDREVVVLYQPYPCEGNEYAVSFAHRPPERWYGRDLDGEEHVFEPKTYDKGEWNIPNVVWWLDFDLPKKMKINYDTRRKEIQRGS